MGQGWYEGGMRVWERHFCEFGVQGPDAGERGMHEAREWDKGGTRVVQGCGDAVTMSLRCEGKIWASAGCMRHEGGTRVG